MLREIISITAIRLHFRANVIVAGCLFVICLFPRNTASASDESPISVVVLPAQFISGRTDQTTAAAELACDRLSRELEKSSRCRVVDRTQVDRLLQEHKIGTMPAVRFVSYDAMIRLEVDSLRPAPKVQLSLIDLSDGNILAEAEFPWSIPMPDSVIKDMAAVCQSLNRPASQPAVKLLRVRLLEVDGIGKSARFDPLAEKLHETFANALARSKDIRPIHHLEAQTAKEESLLLLMGLSKLAGGQFTPQSDAAIELKIRELEGAGKTFEQTQVEVGWTSKGDFYRIIPADKVKKSATAPSSRPAEKGKEGGGK